jgi:hypothetical protein
MEFTPAEKRYLHREHAELRMPHLLTLEEFRALGCPDHIANAAINSQLEKRARQLGPKFEAQRKVLAGQPFEPAAPNVALEDRIAANQLF